MLLLQKQHFEARLKCPASGEAGQRLWLCCVSRSSIYLPNRLQFGFWRSRTTENSPASGEAGQLNRVKSPASGEASQQ
ncbi:hypothetical protein [Algoriphagus sp.]|uniref:hypothetical protein n=1 Tax=Algoriphagus sp. TaxID=1872435 RepID=UPI00391D9790